MTDERRVAAPDGMLHGAISRETSRAIYNDALDAHDDPGHPCHRFVALQRDVPDGWVWQLPIPFMGRRAELGIVFLGINPSYGPGDDPRWGCDLETFDRYWRECFDSDARAWPRLYQRYRRLAHAPSTASALGRTLWCWR